MTATALAFDEGAMNEYGHWAGGKFHLSEAAWAELESPKAPHEVGATLRMPQHGVSGPDIAKRLNRGKMQVVHELKLDQDAQKDAELADQIIYNDRVVVCSKCGNAMETNTGFAGKIHYRCPPPCGTANYNTTTKVG